jgi:protein disulfide-isomerase A1
VLVLDDDNFEEALVAHSPLLVEFYAPWCGHCKKLAPEYAKAAATLAADSIKIAKVDATVAKGLAERFSIQGFPTLKFFPAAGAAPVDFNGGREAADIVKWVKAKSGPATTAIASAAEMAQLEAKEVVAFGLFAAGSAGEKAFAAAALAAEDATFASSSADDVRAALGVAAGEEAVVVVTRFKGEPKAQHTFAGDKGDSAKVAEFVTSNSLPPVIAFTSESAPKIFRGPIKTHFLLFAEDKSTAELAAFRKAADGFKGRALFVTVAPSEERITQYFGVVAADMPTAVLVSMPDGAQMKKFSWEKGAAITEAALTAFATDYFAGKLKPYLKSEPVPTGTDNGVTVVVGKNFEAVALNAEKDVLLEFYAPWCGHCKQLAPEYEKLAKRFAGVPSVTIAKIDATANEVEYEGVNVKGFPTLYFFPAGENKKVVEYDGSRDLDGLTAFLKKNAKTPVTLPGGSDEDDMEL